MTPDNGVIGSISPAVMRVGQVMASNPLRKSNVQFSPPGLEKCYITSGVHIAL